MTEEERRRCCLLGGCGCGSGSPEQRAAMREWLLAKLASIGRAEVGSVDMSAAHAQGKSTIDQWLDELPWKEESSPTIRKEG